MRDRSLFLKWLLSNALAITVLAILGIVVGGRLHGAPLVAIPIILLIFAYANIRAGMICWKADGVKPGTPEAHRLLHESEWLRHWSWNAQTAGILCAVVGFFFILTGGGDNTDLHDRILQGGIIFTGTFVGVFVSQVLEHIKRMIDHDLEG